MNLNKSNLMLMILVVLPLMPYSILMNEVIVGITFLVVAGVTFIIIYRAEKMIKFNIMDYCLIGLLIIILVGSLVISKDKILSFMYSITNIAPIFCYLYIKNTKSNEVDYAKAIILGGGLSSILAIVVHKWNPYMRLEGLFNYANTSGLFYGICIILFIAYNEKLKEEGIYIVYEMLAIILVSTLFATESRGAIIVYILAIIAIVSRESYKLIFNINLIGVFFSILIINKQLIMYLLIFPIFMYIYYQVKDSNKFVKKNLYKYMMLLYIGIIFSIIFIVFKRFGNISIKTPELQERFVIFQDGLNIIKGNILGIGSGLYNKYQFLYQSANYDVKYVHNGLLQLIIDYGIVVIVPVLGIVGLYFINIFKNKNFRSPWFIVFMMISIHSAMDFSMSFVLINIILFTSIRFSFVESNEVFETKKVSRYLTLVAIGGSLLMSALILPYDIVFNYGLIRQKSGTRTSYNVFKSLEAYPIKDNNLYEKLGEVCSARYDEINDESLIDEGIYYYQKYLKVYDFDARAMEELSVLHFKQENGEAGEKLLLDSLLVRRYSPNIYSKLIDLYYLNLNLSVKEENITAISYWKKKISNIESILNDSLDNINPKSRYMKNQLEKGINSEYSSILNEYEELE